MSIILSMFLIQPVVSAENSKDVHVMEKIILSQLHTSIRSALKENYKYDWIQQYDCEQLVEIHEKTLPSGSSKLEEGKYFDLTVELRVHNPEKPDDLVRISFKNDLGTEFKMYKFEKKPVPTNYSCQH